MRDIGFTWTVDVEESGERHIHARLLHTASPEVRELFARVEAFAIEEFRRFYASQTPFAEEKPH